MVASDTLVGLVGAGVLLVALVGVFVYESQAVEGGTADLKNAVDTATATGKVNYDPATGQRPNPTLPCVPPPGEAACKEAQTGFDFTVAGLPPARGLLYMGYVLDGANHIVVGKGQCTPTECKFTKPKSTLDKGGVTKLIISLERSEAPSPTYVLAEFPISNREASGTATINFLGTTGDHRLSFNSLGSDSEVSAVLKNVPNKGYIYHGWMMKQVGAQVNYTYVGVFGADNGNASSYNATLRANIPGGKADYLGFFVTFEQGDAAKKAPGGPNVIEALYGVASSPTVAK